jgi:hypothetical protein
VGLFKVAKGGKPPSPVLLWMPAILTRVAKVPENHNLIEKWPESAMNMRPSLSPHIPLGWNRTLPVVPDKVEITKVDLITDRTTLEPNSQMKTSPLLDTHSPDGPIKEAAEACKLFTGLNINHSDIISHQNKI